MINNLETTLLKFLICAVVPGWNSTQFWSLSNDCVPTSTAHDSAHIGSLHKNFEGKNDNDDRNCRGKSSLIGSFDSRIEKSSLSKWNNVEWNAHSPIYGQSSII